MSIASVKDDGVHMDDPRQSIQAELDETNRSLKEISLMLEQSRVEVNKLTQRNTAITAHLQQIQEQIDKLKGDEIRMSYESALDAQQRLFVMRGQLEKLQSDQSHLERSKALLVRLQESLGGSRIGGGRDREGCRCEGCSRAC